MSKFSIVLNTRELRSLKYHQCERKFYHDILKVEYLQGENLQDDQVSPLTKIQAHPNRDERIANDQHNGLNSASGRYTWKVQREPNSTRLEQLDNQTGEVRPLWQHSGWASIAMASHPLEDALIWSPPQSDCRQWDPSSGTERAFSIPLQRDISALCFAPDGQSLALVHRNEVYTHRLGSPTCRQISQRTEEGNLARAVTHLHPQWSPDGKRLFYTVSSYFWEGSIMTDRLGLVAAMPDGSQRRVLLENPAVANFAVQKE